MHCLLGIDDTDNLESRGTGHRVRQLADYLEESGLAQPLGITRHQLLVAPEIPYTSHNSSACLVAECDPGSLDTLWESTCLFLEHESASGADVGLGLVDQAGVSPEAVAFGRRAKLEVLTQAEAQAAAGRSGVRLAGLTGTGGGMIGALAAIGLRAGGSDGRFLWLPGLRELQGVYTVGQLRELAGIDEVRGPDGGALDPQVRVDVGEWVRPVLREGRAILLAEELEDGWHIFSKEKIKTLTE